MRSQAPSTGIQPGSDRLEAGSFEDFHRASYTRMVRTAHLLTGSNQTAEEVVQEAFVRLHPHFDTVADPIGYLYRSVVDGCRARHRRRQLRERLRTPPPLTEAPPEIHETWTALRRLPPRQRAAVVLRFYAGLPIANIAQALDCPTGTVTSLLHGALAQLEDLVAQPGTPGGPGHGRRVQRRVRIVR